MCFTCCVGEILVLLIIIFNVSTQFCVLSHWDTRNILHVSNNNNNVVCTFFTRAIGQHTRGHIFSSNALLFVDLGYDLISCLVT